MNILRAYMKREGINQGELAKRLGVSQGLVSHYLTGRRRIGRRVAPAVHELTGVPILDILYPESARKR